MTYHAIAQPPTPVHPGYCCPLCGWAPIEGMKEYVRIHAETAVCLWCRTLLVELATATAKTCVFGSHEAIAWADQLLFPRTPEEQPHRGLAQIHHDLCNWIRTRAGTTARILVDAESTLSDALNEGGDRADIDDYTRAELNSLLQRVRAALEKKA